MAKAPAIVLATAITPLDNHLKALAEDINKNYNQAMEGYFKTARAVHDALAYIDDKFPDGINDQAARGMALAAAAYERTGEKQRVFADLSYGARSWNKDRRVIARLEHGPKGANPRYVITNLEGEAKALYERLYCARGASLLDVPIWMCSESASSCCPKPPSSRLSQTQISTLNNIAGREPRFWTTIRLAAE